MIDHNQLQSYIRSKYILSTKIFAEAKKSRVGQDARRAGAEREEAKEARQEGEGKTSPHSSGLTAYEKIV